MSLRPGRQLEGTPYRLLQHLTTDSVTSSFAAEHVVMGTRCVLKIVHAEGVPADERSVVETQAKLLACLRHTNIVSVLDAGMTSERPARGYLVFERVNGRGLREIIDAKPTGIGVAASVHLMSDVYRALDFAHSCGILHRGLMTDSVMLHSVEGRTVGKVSDFVIGTWPRSNRLAREMSIERLRYLAPEQVRGEGCTVATDLYAAALLFCTCLTGKTPLSGVDSVPELLAGKMDPVFPTASDGLPETVPSLQDLLVESLEKLPTRRPLNAKNVLLTLAKIKLELEDLPR